MSPSASLGAGKRPLTVPWRYKVGGLFRVLPRQWNRLDRHGTDIEASQNKANCSGICHYQIRTYDERVRSPTRALMAAGTPEISTFLYQTPVQYQRKAQGWGRPRKRGSPRPCWVVTATSGPVQEPGHETETLPANTPRRGSGCSCRVRRVFDDVPPREDRHQVRLRDAPYATANTPRRGRTSQTGQRPVRLRHPLLCR